MAEIKLGDCRICRSEELTDTMKKKWDRYDWITVARHMNKYLAIIVDRNELPIRNSEILQKLELEKKIIAGSGDKQKIVKIISGNDDGDYDIFMTDAPYSYLKRILTMQFLLEEDELVYIDWLEDDGYLYKLLGTSCDGNELEDDEDDDSLTLDSSCDILFTAAELSEQ